MSTRSAAVCKHRIDLPGLQLGITGDGIMNWKPQRFQAQDGSSRLYGSVKRDLKRQRVRSRRRACCLPRDFSPVDECVW